MPPSAQTLHDKGRQKRQAGDTSGAVKIYQQLTKAFPQDRVGWHNLASSLGDMGSHRAAIDAAQSAQKLGLDAAETWLVLARSYQAIGELTASGDAFDRVLARQPNHTEAHKEFAQLIWMQTGDAQATLSRLSSALQRMPNDLSLGVTLATVLNQIGEKERALSLAIEIARRVPNDMGTQHFAATQALHCERADLAKPLIDRLLISAPDDPSSLSILAQCSLALGAFDEASRLIDDLITHDGYNQFYISMRAVLWRLVGDERYFELYNYTDKVGSYPLSCPPGWSDTTSYVADLSAALRERHPFQRHPFNQSVKGASSQIPDILDDTHPTIAAWPSAVVPAVRDYLEKQGHKAGSDDQMTKRLEAWSVKLTPSGHHTDHVHPAGLVSSACHLLFDAADSAPPGGWLRFGKPGILTPEPLEAEYHVKPKAGMINMFPSYMWHGVTPFDRGTERITIAMDVGR